MHIMDHSFKNVAHQRDMENRKCCKNRFFSTRSPESLLSYYYSCRNEKFEGEVCAMVNVSRLCNTVNKRLISYIRHNVKNVT